MGGFQFEGTAKGMSNLVYNIVENWDKLWLTGGGEQDITEAALPRLLTLPTFVAEFLV